MADTTGAKNATYPLDRKFLEKEFYKGVPKARKVNPFFRTLFNFMYDAHQSVKPGDTVLNVFASHDNSGKREEVYRKYFFCHATYSGVDFWVDTFVKEGEQPDSNTQNRHTLPYENEEFDYVVNTKILMEHVSEPQEVANEFNRVLKPGGKLFIIVPLVRRQHQVPYDYFRYTEFGLRYILEKAGFEVDEIIHSNGFMATATSYAYFFQRGLNVPRFIESFFDFMFYWVIEPVGYTLDRLDNGYGRDMSLYFFAKAKKVQEPREKLTPSISKMQ